MLNYISDYHFLVKTRSLKSRLLRTKLLILILNIVSDIEIIIFQRKTKIYIYLHIIVQLNDLKSSNSDERYKTLPQHNKILFDIRIVSKKFAIEGFVENIYN